MAFQLDREIGGECIDCEASLFEFSSLDFGGECVDL
jgi:hypothetical protein